MENPKNIWIISAGIGTKEYLTVKAIKTAHKMDILVGFERLNLFDHKNFIVLSGDYKSQLLKILKKKDKKIGVVVSGDAGFFSLANFVYKNFKDRIAEVVAGVSSFQVAFAKLKETYEDAAFFSFHHSKQTIDTNHKKIVILCGKYSPSEVLETIGEKLKDFQISICYNLGYENETITDKPIDDKNGLYTVILIRKNG